MTTILAMKRQRRWLYSQGFVTAAGFMDKAIEALKQGEK